MKIYTRTGDHGQTRIVGKQILSKADPRVNAYGEVDELNSWLGYTRSILSVANQGFSAELEEIQQLLFDCGKDLATPKNEPRHPFIFTATTPTAWLEERIDHYTQLAPPVKKFILPGGSPTAAAFHYARTITRRCERHIVALQTTTEINDEVLIFINRLSDYFFAAARVANLHDHQPEVLYRNSEDVFR